MMARLIIFGSGGSEGIPVPFCDCKVCKTWKPRRRPGYVVEIREKSFWLELSPDLREQLLEYKKIPNYFFVSHKHYDHINGLAELKQTLLIGEIRKKVKLIIPNHLLKFFEDLRPFSKISGDNYLHAFWRLREKGLLEIIEGKQREEITLDGTKITTFNNIHGTTLSSSIAIRYKGKTFLYLADAESIDDDIIDYNESIGKFDLVLAHSPFLFQKKGHIGLEDLKDLKAKKIVISHISHKINMEEREVKEKLKRISEVERKEFILAEDGMVIEF